MAATVNQRGYGPTGAKASRTSTVRRTRTELKRTTSLQLQSKASYKEVTNSGSKEDYLSLTSQDPSQGSAKVGLEGEVAELEVELAAVEERVSLLIHQIEEKMPLYKQVNPSNAFFGNLSKMPLETHSAAG